VPNYAFTLNGKQVTVDAPADMSLLWVLRDLLGVTGPKYGCGVGVCRACTCHVNGNAVQICTLTASDVVGKKVTTIEGLGPQGGLHPYSRRGSMRTWRSAASASPDRSCRPRHC
jgi:isoquinoline 1-oxidoreductase alpha subunit